MSGGICLCQHGLCTLAFLLGELVCFSRNNTCGLDHHKRLGEEEYYFLFHIIIHNAGVINPRTCGFISSCRGAKLKCELSGQVHSLAEMTEIQDAAYIMLRLT